MTTYGNRQQAAIDAALAAGDIAGAAALAEAALARGVDTPMVLNLAAWARETAGDFAGAHALLDRALRRAPRDPLIIAAVGTVLRKQGRLREALARFDAALAIDPHGPATWLERGHALEAGGAYRAALDSFARSAALDATAAAHGSAAAVAARIGDPSARAHADAALARDPAHPAAGIAMVRLDLEAGDADAAAARLDRLLARPLADDDRCLVLELAGDAFDRLGQTRAAFDRYAEAKALTAARYADAFAGAPPQRDLIERLDRELAALDPAAWAAAPAATAARAPVFLLGYPRSGTTLVENILASAPGVVALEERATLRAADGLLAGPLADLTAMEATALAPYREAYWAEVAAAGADPDARLVVDMDPLKGLKLPLIARLFPHARVVVMRRDPRDVVWSCFHTGFSMNAAAFAFTDLMETARHYDALMRLTARCLARLPVAAHVVRYDALIADFDATTQALAAFVGLDWSPEWRRFDRTARARGVATASVAQVRRGLYDGRGQWRRYADALAPVLPILQPWVDAFGFDRDARAAH